mmetsp:Transcript_68271/g.131822  ORF Transcript_68271/g.131822 Transcript_68271/m.131822 type:complete len:206 (-) Transcript_68271:1304-1921(-)
MGIVSFDSSSTVGFTAEDPGALLSARSSVGAAGDIAFSPSALGAVPAVAAAAAAAAAGGAVPLASSFATFSCCELSTLLDAAALTASISGSSSSSFSSFLAVKLSTCSGFSKPGFKLAAPAISSSKAFVSSSSAGAGAPSAEAIGTSANISCFASVFLASGGPQPLVRARFAGCSESSSSPASRSGTGSTGTSAYTSAPRCLKSS